MTLRRHILVLSTLAYSAPWVLVGGAPMLAEEVRDPCRASMYPVPVVFYTPETELGVGVGVPSSRPDPTDCINRKPDLLVPALIYTQRRQVIARVFAKQFFDDENFFIDAIGAFNRYPDKFYGTGDGTALEDEELFTEKYASFSGDFYRRIAKDTYVGPALIRDEYQIVDTKADAMLASGAYDGSDTGTISGSGLRFLHNSRDNEFQPRRGAIGELGALSFQPSIGSDFNYRMYHARWRSYSPLGPTDILAFEAVLDANVGEIPFRKLAQLGGQYLMRGFFLGRYRDKALAASQVEWRHDVTDAWSVVGFFGSGKVAPAANELNQGRAITSAGFGGRYVLDPQSRINLRLDIAAGGDSRGIYFGAGEAF